jgi:uncharacterized protein (TIGR03435 family)
MIRQIVLMTFVLSIRASEAQAVENRPAAKQFDVATIKDGSTDEKSARFIKMQGVNRFVVKNYSLKLLVAAAYDLNPRTISGGADWTSSDHYDIAAITPGQVLPARGEQMAMLRGLLTERFKLTFHREPKDFSIYVLELAKGGSRLKESTAPAETPAALISMVYPQRIVLPARNATMAEFTSLLQRAVLDRPVVNKTGLTGRYDFDLEWAPDEIQFGGEVAAASAEATAAPFFSAVQQQLGLKLEATKGPVDALVIDTVERPSAN